MSDAVQGVEFGELPPKPPRQGFRRGPSKEWIEVADQLKANPGQWAKVIHKKVEDNKSAHGVAVRIRKGSLAAFAPGGAFEVEVRGAEVWVRYVGEPTEDVAEQVNDSDEDIEDEVILDEDDESDETEDGDKEEQPVVRF